jgi:protease IV
MYSTGRRNVGYLDDEITRIGRKQRLRRYGLLIGIAVIAIAAVALGLTFLGNLQEERVSVITLSGEITSGDVSLPGYVGSETIGRQIRAAADDSRVDAIVLRINSPGGTPAAAQEIIADIEYAKSKKPVVVSMGDIAASAAYYISAHASRIYANPDTLTGSIGTTWTFIDISEWMENEGYSVDVVKSGSKKDMSSPYRPLSQEEIEYAQRLVNESFEAFITDIIEQRHVARELIEDGRVMRGEEALRIGLVDELGNVYDAVEGAKRLSSTN